MQTAPVESRAGRAAWHRWSVVLGAWAAVAAISVAQIWVARSALGHPPPLGPLLVLELPVWLFWALVTVPIVWLARSLPLDRTRVLGSVAVHGAAAIVISLLAVAFQTLWYQAFNPYPYLTGSVTTWFWQYFRQHFVVGFMIYWATIGVYHAFTNYFLSRRQELEAVRAKQQLSDARLQALRMQLHPHFLFNTLNSISALLEDQPADARRLIAQLGELLRASLRSDALHVVPLEDEIRFLRAYHDIEQARFGERLQISFRIEPDTLRAGVPSFLLQPLAENAIRHGIARRDVVGRMWVSAERKNGSLVIHVQDDGPGPPPNPAGLGIGLANTRRRLAELYGEQQILALEVRPGGGTDVRVELPFRAGVGA
jgi:signal transduction histidine kinase